MKTQAKIVLDKRRKLKDDYYPIVIRFTHKRQPVYINLDFSVSEDDWDAGTERIKAGCRKYKNVARINNDLLKQRIKVDELLERLNLKGEISGLSPTQVKKLITCQPEQVTFRSFTIGLIEQFTQAKQLGNAFVYRQALNFIERHTGKSILNFDEIDYSLIKKLEIKHFAANNSWNGLSFYLRTIRAIYNRAVKAGVARRELYPFTEYSIREEKTRKRAISKEEIAKIRTLNLPKGSRMWHARNYFLFSFNNMGMNFADIAQLKVSDIANGRLTYKRAKTGRNYSIKVTPEASTILGYYLEGKQSNEFVFPIIQRKGVELQRKDEENERKLFNYYLKKIAGECGIQSHLTSYVARHSWATVGKASNVPIAAISQGLGHEDIKTTQIYLDDFDNEIIDSINLQITE